MDITTENDKVIGIAFGQGKNIVSLVGKATPSVTVPRRLGLTCMDEIRSVKLRNPS